MSVTGTIIMTSLEDELQIPPDANIPKSSDFFLKVLNGSNIALSQATSIRSIHKTAADATQQQPRCLIVGRQASTSDIRIQHGSISRKHAVFFFLGNNTLMLKDFGGKHGTRVNGQLIQGAIELRNNDVITFGTVWESTFTVQGPSELPLMSEVVEGANLQADMDRSKGQMENDLAQEEDITLKVAVTRQDREAQIAAMVASLDEKPVYTKVSQEIFSHEETPRTVGPFSQAKLHGLPIADELHIDAATDTTTKHTLNSLVVDKSGSRFAIGIGPYLRLYDFSGMDRLRTKPFKTISVEEGYNVEHICYSNSGDRILVGTASPQPSVFDRDGESILQFVRGDQYVMDMARTSGHVHEVTGVDWHPLERDIVLTSSLDGSARLWNLKGKTLFQKLVCDKVYRAKNARGQRIPVTAAAFHPGGREFAIGTACGSLQIWSSSKVGPRPERVVYNAHASEKAISAIVYNTGGTHIATRSSSDTSVHVWDARCLSKSSMPITTCSNVPTIHERSSCDFSPNGKYLVVGCSGFLSSEPGKPHEVGYVSFFQINCGQSAQRIEDVQAKAGVGVVQVKWHGKLNQIFVGCSDGSVMVLFDETISKHGAMITLSKAGRKVDGLSELLSSRSLSNPVIGEIVTPLASQARSGKRKNTDEDSSKAGNKRRPELPATGIKVGGHSSASATFTQFIARTLLTKEGQGIAGRDPREDLFKYHTSETPSGKSLLAEKTAEAEEEELKSMKFSKSQT